MEQKARFLLNATDCFSPNQQCDLLRRFGNAELMMSNDQWLQEFPDHQRQLFLSKRDKLDQEHLYEQLLAEGVNFLLKEDEDYPPSLRFIDTPPHLLYIKGELPKNSLCGISIVGTRNPSLYGRQMAQWFSQSLACEGLTIISGAAHGIDATALQAALDVNGTVVAILGTGIDRVYPRENSSLFDQIIKRGALVSEFAPGARPLKHHFPWRNRMISGWSLGLLVVEARVQSGSLRSVEWALKQGKDIYAIPGNINSELSKGPHQMIRDGATLVEHPKDILDAYPEVVEAFQKQNKSDGVGQLDPQESELGLIKSPRALEELMIISGKNVVELTQALNKEVLSGHAKRWPGSQFSLI